MNLSMQWLRDFCDCSDIDPKHFADVMTDTGSKVESVTMRGADIENVRVGKVLEMARHPDSDHLWICQVDCGESTNRQIVTGAQNVHVGDMVPAGKVAGKCGDQRRQIARGGIKGNDVFHR